MYKISFGQLLQSLKMGDKVKKKKKKGDEQKVRPTVQRSRCSSLAV